MAVASLLFLVVPRRRRLNGLLLVLFSAGTITLLGCGSGAKPIDGGTGTGTGTTTTTPTAAGVYVINVTATGTASTGQALVHTVYLTLNVTQ